MEKSHIFGGGESNESVWGEEISNLGGLKGPVRKHCMSV